MKDSWPSYSKATHPLSTRTLPHPRSSTWSLYAQPRSIAVADGVFTKNKGGGGQMSARIGPRSSDMRCSPARDVSRRTRLFGSTSTMPIDPTSILARDAASVVTTCPIGSRDGASIRVPATSGAPASDCTVHPEGRTAFANDAAPITSPTEAAAVSACISAAGRRRWEVGGAVRSDKRERPAERGGMARIVEPPPRRQEDVRHEVVHLVASDPGQEQAMDHPPVGVVQTGKCRRIPVERRPDE